MPSLPRYVATEQSSRSDTSAAALSACLLVGAACLLLAFGLAMRGRAALGVAISRRVPGSAALAGAIVTSGSSVSARGSEVRSSGWRGCRASNPATGGPDVPGRASGRFAGASARIERSPAEFGGHIAQRAAKIEQSTNPRGSAYGPKRRRKDLRVSAR